MLNNLNISTRLAATFAMLVAAMLAIAFTAIFQMGIMWRNADEISTLWLPVKFRAIMSPVGAGRSLGRVS